VRRVPHREAIVRGDARGSLCRSSSATSRSSRATCSGCRSAARSLVAVVLAVRRGLSWRGLPFLLSVGAVAAGLVLVWSQRLRRGRRVRLLSVRREPARRKGPRLQRGRTGRGYTNFLWTVLVAAIAALTRISIPHVALVLDIASYLALVAVVHRLGRRLSPETVRTCPSRRSASRCRRPSRRTPRRDWRRLFAVVWIHAMLLAILAVPAREARRIAGFAASAAVLTRLDHGVFLVAGGVALVARNGGPRTLWKSPAARREVAAFLPARALPRGGARLAALVLRQPAPEHVLCEGGRGVAPGPGRGLRGHLPPRSPRVGLARVLRRVVDRARRRRPPSGSFAPTPRSRCPAWCLYVLKVGGDFMYGRFWLPVVPDAPARFGALRAPLRRSPLVSWPRFAAIFALGAALRGVPLIERRDEVAGIADESSFYRSRPRPARNRSRELPRGHALRIGAPRFAGITPPIATCCIGMVGYYSGLELIDTHGLTTSTSPTRSSGRARASPATRSWPRSGILVKRGVRLARYAPAEEWRTLTQPHLRRKGRHALVRPDLRSRPDASHRDRGAGDRLRRLSKRGSTTTSSSDLPEEGTEAGPPRPGLLRLVLLRVQRRSRTAAAPIAMAADETRPGCPRRLSGTCGTRRRRAPG
jgi:hypothetical protein